MLTLLIFIDENRLRQVFEGQGNGWNKGRKGDCRGYGVIKAARGYILYGPPSTIGLMPPYESPLPSPQLFFSPPTDIKLAQLDIQILGTNPPPTPSSTTHPSSHGVFPSMP